jgi:AraC family transcriptional regulator, regulatory protein of adaptative response / methylated-DNA-[protein]-cysteine methyltransferase
MKLVSATHYADLRFGAGASSLGQVLVAATDAGVAAVLFGADTGELLADLTARFPGARIEPGIVRLDAVLTVIESPARDFAGPLAVSGTDFQRRVWTALTAIPAGETRSYAEVAQTIGAPASVRAVAGACAANPIAVLIPCHRVVRGDGSLAGYRWGVERKRALLERERALALAA